MPKRGPGFFVRLSARLRELVLLPLFGSFVFVSFVAQTNYPDGFPQAPLSAKARQGLRLWRQHNCQACHQLYGFGGFLGPDLTNSITEQTGPGDFYLILTEGKKQMPAFHFSRDDQEALLAFLRSVNETGRSRPRGLQNGNAALRTDHFADLLAAWERESDSAAPDRVKEGSRLFRENGCDDCHVPFVRGLNRAPDLSRHVSRTSVVELREITAGRSDRMPTYALPEGQLDAISAFLGWVKLNRPTLVEVNVRLRAREQFSWRDIPWFEYR